MWFLLSVSAVLSCELTSRTLQVGSSSADEGDFAPFLSLVQECKEKYPSEYTRIQQTEPFLSIKSSFESTTITPQAAVILVMSSLNQLFTVLGPIHQQISDYENELITEERRESLTVQLNTLQTKADLIQICLMEIFANSSLEMIRRMIG
jgi:hypothetical protein